MHHAFMLTLPIKADILCPMGGSACWNMADHGPGPTLPRVALGGPGQGGLVIWLVGFSGKTRKE